MGACSLCDAGTHQPVEALDCLYPVTGRYALKPLLYPCFGFQNATMDFGITCIFKSFWDFLPLVLPTAEARTIDRMMQP